MADSGRPRRRTVTGDGQGLTVRARAFSSSDRPPRVHNLLSGADQSALAAVASVFDYPAAGMPVFAEGDTAGMVYAIAAGAVRVARHNQDGDRLVLAFMWPGDLFGIAEDGLYVNSAETLIPTTLYAFRLEELERLLLKRPALQMQMLVKAIHELRRAQHHLIVLAEESARKRLASFLVTASQQVEIFDYDSGVLHLPISRKDIADYLGVSAETVTRGVKELEDEGVLERRGPRSLKINNMPTLMRIAGDFA